MRHKTKLDWKYKKRFDRFVSGFFPYCRTAPGRMQASITYTYATIAVRASSDGVMSNPFQYI